MNASSSLKPLFDLVGADEKSELFLYGSLEEAVCGFFFSFYLDVTRKNGKNHFVIAAHSASQIVAGAKLMEELACCSEFVSLTAEGMLSEQMIAEAITARTALLSLPLACPVTGVIQPLEAISRLCRERGVLLHLDITTLVGKMALCFKELHADVVSFKTTSLTGTAATALVVNPRCTFRPRLPTPFNSTFLKTLVDAAQKASGELYTYCTEVAMLRSYFEETLAQKIAQIQVLHGMKRRAPHISALHFPHIASSLLCFHLERKALSGQAHPEAGLSTVGFTFTATDNEITVNACIDQLVYIYNHLQKLVLL